MFFTPSQLRPPPPKKEADEAPPDAIRLVFCPKPGCGCTYINQCPMHGAPPREGST